MFEHPSEANGESSFKMSTKISPIPGQSKNVYKYEGTCRTNFRISDWADPTFVLFKCEGEAYVLHVVVTKGYGASRGLDARHEFTRTGFQNSFIDMLEKLQGRRSELDALRQKYLLWRQTQPK
jgi:hypothetical protein